MRLSRRAALLLLGCLVAGAAAAHVSSRRPASHRGKRHLRAKHAQRGAAVKQGAVELYVMPTPQPWPLTCDPTTEEVVPGLDPTDGFAINASTPNLEPLAPIMDTIRPVGPIMHTLMGLMNRSDTPPTLPGHGLQNYTSLTVLYPNAQALLQLPHLIENSGVTEEADNSFILVPFLGAYSRQRKLSKIYNQIAQNMVLPRMVPYQYLNNHTRLTTKLGFPVEVVTSMDGSEKWFVSGNSSAKILVPDYGGRPMQPWVTMMVDSFLLPLNWKL